ncbi:PAS domain-containing protein [Sphingomonas glaciei]|uniref:histidine kinase n=1 Tax=Sphingomonas glaciei TaxID=2938948 RepID=A0ABY5MT09_9SPHN|nr:PAS domain-containing protein [Sphingomonas glaciei]UUR07071.1 PAS domain-containing protein [Sphingomonas glaciei]
MANKGGDVLTDALGGFDFKRILGIADALPMPLSLIDSHERYLFCNQALADFLERPRTEILGRPIGEVIGKAAYDIRKPLIAAALQGERQWFAAEYDHPSRGTVAIQTQYLPQREADGSISGIVILVTDVTEQRVAERALRESEARFRRIANSAPVIMWVTRLDRHREFVNDEYLSFTGVARDQVNAHEWRDFIHPDDFERVVVESMAGEASRRPFSLEARYKRADGAYRWLRSVSSPRFGPDGELIGFIGAAFDVTVAKEAESELRQQVDERTAEVRKSEVRLRAIFDSVREVVVLLEPDGTVIQLNRTEASWRDKRADEAIGKKLWEAPTLSAYPEHKEAVSGAIALAATGVPVTRDIILERAGSPTAYLDVSFRPVAGQDGAVLYILFEARDVTELKAAQEQLRQSQKMEALGQLTGGIAHDFNNLLTVVVGGLDLIVRRAEDPKLGRYARNALEAAERGARLTAQLLAFSRVQRLEVRPTLVAPLISNMRPLLRNVLGPGVEKRIELDEAAIPVLADPTQLELAVLNLAINARDAMPEGGLLTITTAPVTVSDDPELEPGDYIELSIGDTGSGMPEEVVARAFEPFFTTKEVGKGTGLGLSMVYGVARQSGGTARIDSRPGEGTTVRLYFRHAEGSQAKLEEEAVAEERDSRAVEPAARVLVVDDDPDVRGFVVASLEDLGYQVAEAADGAAALSEYRRETPDLVVLDYLMPGMSGAEVAREIRQDAPEQRILFVSGYSETDAIRAAAPGAALLAKPFRTEALAACVRKVLSGP